MSSAPADGLGWKIWYADGSSSSSRDGTPEAAPSFGVICIVFPDDVVGRVIMHGWDWYYWMPEDRQWWGSDIHGLLDRLLHNLPVAALKQGRSVSNRDFRAIMRAARLDPDFPRKSAYSKGERPA